MRTKTRRHRTKRRARAKWGRRGGQGTRARSRSRSSRQTRSRNRKKGGKAIGNGGFACVFYPALKCKSPANGNSSGTGTPKISKLMKSKYAKEEYNTILEIRRRLADLPNMSQYFLLNDVAMCSPTHLSESDLQQYTQKCKPLIKMSITKKNINKPGVNSKLMAIQEPFGGVDIDTFLSKNVFQNPFLVVYLVDSLIDLFENGIMPMHEKGIYHCDIKDSNVLVQFESGKVVARLIDWGISVVYNAQTRNQNSVSGYGSGSGAASNASMKVEDDSRPFQALVNTFAQPVEEHAMLKGGNNHLGTAQAASEAWMGERMETWNTLPASSIPHNLFDRPFHFNAPFSIVMFNNMFPDQYNLYLNSRPEHLRNQPLTAHESREFVSQFVPMWCQSRGDGHLSVIHQLFGKVLGMNQTTASWVSSIATLKPNNANPYLIDYLEKVVRAFGKQDGPASEDKFNQYFMIYLSNADTWGFLTLFISIYEMFMMMDRTHIPKSYLEELKTLVVSWLLEYVTITIPEREIVQSLREWNQRVRVHFQTQMANAQARTRTSEIEVVVS